MKKIGLTRRSFIAASALTGASLLAIGKTDFALAKTVVAQPEETEVICSVMCANNCQSACRLYAHIRKGVLVKTSMAPFKVDGKEPIFPSDERYNTICLRGLSHAQRLYNPNRILYPLKQTKERGDVKSFVRISWEQAIKEIAQKIASYPRKNNSMESVSVVTASGNLGYINGIYGGMSILNSILGSYHMDSGLDFALPVGISRVQGLETFPFRSGNEPLDLLNSKTIFLWGSNMAESHLIAWGIVADAKQKGAKIVDIDVISTITTAKADLFAVIKSGTDTMLALAMMNILFYEKPEWLDIPFLYENSVAPFMVREDNKMFLRAKDIPGNDKNNDGYVAYNNKKNKYESTEWKVISRQVCHNEGRKAILPGGADYNLETTRNIKVNIFDTSGNITGTKFIKVSPAFALLKAHVKKYTPEFSKDYTGIEPDVTRRLLSMYAAPENKPSSIYLGFGLSQYYNSHHTGHAICALATLTGNIMRKGASVGNFFDKKRSIVGIPRPATPLLHLPAVHVRTALEKENHPLRMLIIACSNPVTNYVNQKKDWLDYIIPKMDCIVTVDSELSDTAIYSDYVLPSIHWFEGNELLGSLTKHPFNALSEKVVEPQGEAKADIDIARLLVAELDKLMPELDGSKWFIKDGRPKTDIEYIESAIDPKKQPELNITAERLFKEKIIRNGNTPYILGEDGFMPTDSGRLEFLTEKPELYTKVVPYGQILTEEEKDLERLPCWEEPSEAYFGPSTKGKKFEELRKKYPLQLLSERVRWRVHSQWSQTPWLREQELEPSVKIGVKDAKKYGNIVTGDYIKISNDRGVCIAKVTVSNGMPEGIIGMPKGWSRTQYTDKFGYAGSFQELTNPDYHKVGVAQIFHDARVKIEKLS